MEIITYVECRPNLRACNFFIKSDGILETSTITVEETQINIELPSQTIFTLLLPHEALCLMPNSITGLAYTQHSISFRCQIKDLSLPDEGKLFADSPNFKKGDKVRFACAKCMEYLSEQCAFNRILPLPSSEEFDNFFCHHHTTYNNSLDPRDSDLFYNSFFYKVHTNKLSDIRQANLLKCPKCRATLGETQDQCAKLWNSTVHILQSNKGQLKSPLQMHVESIKSFVNDLVLQMNKFVFTSQFEDGTTHYILVWVVDRRLTVLSGRGHSLEKSAQLDISKVMKVMYSFHQELTVHVNEWLKSFSTSVVSIPPQIEGEFLNYLEMMAQNIPSDYTLVDKFMKLSYI